MNQTSDRRFYLYLILLGTFPVIWLALILAPAINNGIFAIMEQFQYGMNHPLEIQLCEDSMKTVLLFLTAYGMGIGIYWSTRRNYRMKEE